ncbi:DinB family protein [Streptomyces sp. NPDC002054]|uniref:DinB family protein n=1 Tax=Streptomyces sp. NPDC002054 TaxID=3154663 RepID=UPI00331AE454
MDLSEHGNEPAVTRWTQSTVYADMWVDPADDPRETDTAITDERGMLLDHLRGHRLTLEMKCAGLDAEQMALRSVPPSTMSLLGLVRHMTEEERRFRRVMAGENAPMLYRTEEDRDGDWNGAIADPAVVEDAWRQWRAEIELTDRYLANVTDLDTRNAGFNELGPEPGGEEKLRDVLVAQIAEYARHCGHADLLRERVDGRVGQ